MKNLTTQFSINNLGKILGMHALDNIKVLRHLLKPKI